MGWVRPTCSLGQVPRAGPSFGLFCNALFTCCVALALGSLRDLILIPTLARTLMLTVPTVTVALGAGVVRLRLLQRERGGASDEGRASEFGLCFSRSTVTCTH